MKEYQYKTKDLYVCHLSLCRSNGYEKIVFSTKTYAIVCIYDKKSDVYVNVLSGLEYRNADATLRGIQPGTLFIREVQRFTKDEANKKPRMTASEIRYGLSLLNKNKSMQEFVDDLMKKEQNER